MGKLEGILREFAQKTNRKKQRNGRRAIEAIKTQKSIFVEGRQLFMRIKQN